MRRVVNLLVILAVLLCGSHLSPAEADARAMHAAETRLHLPADDHGQADMHTGVGQAGHHHCPLAPDLDGGLAPCEAAPVDALLFEPPIAQLRSLATAPPIEPPAA